MLVDPNVEITRHTPGFDNMLAAHSDKHIFVAREGGGISPTFMLLRGGHHATAYRFLRACLPSDATDPPDLADRMRQFLAKPEYGDGSIDLGGTWLAAAAAEVEGVCPRLRLFAPNPRPAPLQSTDVPLLLRVASDAAAVAADAGASARERALAGDLVALLALFRPPAEADADALEEAKLEEAAAGEAPGD